MMKLTVSWLIALAACSSNQRSMDVAGSVAGMSASPASPTSPSDTQNSAAGSGGAGAQSMTPTSAAGRSAATSGVSGADSNNVAGRSQTAAGASATGAAGMSMGNTSSGSAGAAGAPSTANGCSRDSLRAQVDKYFAALSAHDPAQLPQAAGLKFTENAMTTQLGEGLLWKTAGPVKFTRSLFDTERCGTVTEAVVPNSGTDTIFGLRLKVVDQKLTEIESIVVDPDDGFSPMPNGILSSKAEVWEEILPAEQRSTREALEAAGKAYFAWFGDSSVQPPFAMPCDRLENGLKTTQGSCANLGGAMGLKQPAQRYPFSDLEAGITAGFVLFAGADIDFHMFKVVGGKITRINAVVGPSVRSAGW